MKYGVAVTITQTGYIEVEADCEEEAKAKAAEGIISPSNFLPSSIRRFFVNSARSVST